VARVVSGSKLRGPTRRVIVTGAAGFIGFHAVLHLLAKGAQVLAFDSLNDYYSVSLKRARLSLLEQRNGFRFIRADLTEAASFFEAVEQFKPTSVLHLAAQAGVRYSLQNPRAYIDSNITGFLTVLEACRFNPIKHLVYASSSSVYGANTKVPFSEDDPVEAPNSLYAVTKRENELMAYAYSKLFNIPATGLRFFTVYGPWGRPDMAYYIFTKSIFEDRPIEVFNHGRMERDFTYIDDVVSAIGRLMSKPPTDTQVPHRIFNIGNHSPVALGSFIEVIEAAVGKRAQKRYLDMQPGDVPRTYADVSRLSAAVDFAPSTPIEAGIAKFVDWFRQYHRV
jgi:UDP-glucuronate 4-epimerase